MHGGLLTLKQEGQDPQTTITHADGWLSVPPGPLRHDGQRAYRPSDTISPWWAQAADTDRFREGDGMANSRVSGEWKRGEVAWVHEGDRGNNAWSRAYTLI